MIEHLFRHQGQKWSFVPASVGTVVSAQLKTIVNVVSAQVRTIVPVVSAQVKSTLGVP